MFVCACVRACVRCSTVRAGVITLQRWDDNPTGYPELDEVQLQVIPGSRRGNVPARNSNALWAITSANISRGGVVTTDHQYTFLNLATERYLAAVPTQEGGDALDSPQSPRVRCVVPVCGCALLFLAVLLL